MATNDAVPFIQKHLLPGEPLVVSARFRSAGLYIRGGLFFVVVCMLFIAVMRQKLGIIGVLVSFHFGIIVVVTGLWFLLARIRCEFAEVGLTDRRLIIKSGALIRSVGEMALDSIEWIAVEQDIFGRIFDYGKVEVVSTSRTRRVLGDISRPFEFRQKIHELIAAQRQATQ